MRGSAWMPALYFLVGQAGWFACVLSAAHGLPVIGVIVVGTMLLAHVLRVPGPALECRLLVFVMVLGAVWESVLVRTHLLSYPTGTLLQGFAPYWIVVVWA